MFIPLIKRILGTIIGDTDNHYILVKELKVTLIANKTI